MKIEINGIPENDKAQTQILEYIDKILKLMTSYKYTYEEAKGK